MSSRLRDQSIARRAGFTLIQVMAVLAAVVMCFAIYFKIAPAFIMAKDNDRYLACRSNLKRIGLAVMEYAQDNDNKYPRAVVGPLTPNTTVSWRRVVAPYLDSDSYWQCWSNPVGGSINRYDSLPHSYNVVDVGPIQRYRSISVRQVGYPGRTILCAEESGDGAEASEPAIAWDHDAGTAGWTNILFAGHYGGSEYLFTDGHVKWMKPWSTVANGINMWHLNNHDSVTPGALKKLKAAEANFQ